MKLIYHQFNPRTTENHGLRNAGYKLFQNIWQKTLNELDGDNHLYSDAYLYADKVCILMNEDQPLALHIHNQHLVSNPINFNLRSMQHYPAALMDWFQKEHINELYLLEYLCVHPDYRRINGTMLANLTSYLSLKTFKNSSSCLAMGVTHDLRKVNEIAISHGMRRLINGKHMLHQVPVSYFGLHKNWELLRPNEELAAIGDKLFNEMETSHSQNNENNNLRIAA